MKNFFILRQICQILENGKKWWEVSKKSADFFCHWIYCGFFSKKKSKNKLFHLLKYARKMKQRQQKRNFFISLAYFRRWKENFFTCWNMREKWTKKKWKKEFFSFFSHISGREKVLFSPPEICEKFLFVCQFFHFFRIFQQVKKQNSRSEKSHTDYVFHLSKHIIIKNGCDFD